MPLLRLLGALGLIVSGSLLLSLAKRARQRWMQATSPLILLAGVYLLLTNPWFGLSRFFTVSPASIPVALPLITSTAPPQPATVVATLYHACLRWDQVRPDMNGQQVCVYGVVKDYSENAKTRLTNLYFRSANEFFFVSTYRWKESYDGKCIVANGKVQLNTYKTPYIKIDEIASCQAWMK